MPAGRPSKYGEHILKKAESYLANYRDLGDLIPSVVGLADELHVCEKTLYNWADDNPEFLQMLNRIKSKQHRKLLEGGLGGEFNSNITKLVLAKHNYSDKQAIDATSSDGSMTPQVIERVIIKPDHGS